jgi:hypothetical protein
LSEVLTDEEDEYIEEERGDDSDEEDENFDADLSRFQSALRIYGSRVQMHQRIKFHFRGVRERN